MLAKFLESVGVVAILMTIVWLDSKFLAWTLQREHTDD